MRNFRNIVLVLLISLFCTKSVFSATVWINDLKSVFLANKAVIYAINIRTFNSNDKNKNGIIEEELGEERGTFLNAIDRLDELSALGVNTVQLLPVTPVGKVKALGTAGSLYAASSFNELNPQLKSKNSALSINDEMRRFVDECHNRNIRVIVDLPACGSYDLYLNNPELFIKDKNNNPVTPADWTDVRLLDAGTNEQINMDVYNLYSDFVNLMLSMDVDGIRADVPSLKPFTFWKKLIESSRVRNPQLLFLAESSASDKKISGEYFNSTPLSKLLEAGFDGYYGQYSNLKDWKTSNDLFSAVKSDIELSKRYPETKKVVGNFATHDLISPILVNGPQFSKMIIWLNATLPLNSYSIDGFPTGDDYIYLWANKKAPKTFTDDDYYFAHRGQLDIFNFSRKPVGKYFDLLNDFIVANKFRKLAKNPITDGTFTPLKASSASVFAYCRNYDKDSVIVVGNLDFKKTQNAVITIPKISNELISIPIKISNIPVIVKDKITTTLAPGEVQVLYFTSPSSK